DAGAAQDVSMLQEEDIEAGPGQVGGTDQAVAPPADDDRVMRGAGHHVALRFARPPHLRRGRRDGMLGRPLTPSEILALFDAHPRADPLPEPGVHYQRAGAVLRAMGDQNWIERAELDDADVDAVIAAEAAHFRSIGAEVEWKVYGHDRPADLG